MLHSEAESLKNDTGEHDEEFFLLSARGASVIFGLWSLSEIESFASLAHTQTLCCCITNFSVGILERKG
jgi:hypothetical protein